MDSVKNNLMAVLAIILALVALGLGLKKNTPGGKIAFVDTQRLLTAFKEAHLINKEIKVQDEKWKENSKVMEDSLKAFMERMSASFDNGSIKEKRELQDELAMRNQQMNNYQRKNVERIANLTNEKMQVVYDKINAFMQEYGDKHGYNIILGTTQGNILYGTSTPADITNEIIKELNKRYE